MDEDAPRLLVVAHGTASPAGSATTAALVEAVRARRPHVEVGLCFLDVVRPRLAAALDERPSIAVPLLLSTGYHVQTDIPAAVAPFPATTVARHLGPHPLLAEALADRLGPLGDDEQVVLVATGSSRPEAAGELAEAGRLLAARIGREVEVRTTMDDLRAAFEQAAPVAVATYLLAEGAFVDRIAAAVSGRGRAAPPIGVHPALVDLVWQRYDDAAPPRPGRG